MTIEQLQKALNSITGNSPIAKARRRAIIEQINKLINETV